MWPFKTHTTPLQPKGRPTHQLIHRIENHGVFYCAEPVLEDWAYQWSCFGEDAATLSLLNQIEELGYLDNDGQQLFLSWDGLFQFLAEDGSNASQLLSLLKLPQLTDYRPSLASHGSLEDLNFRITLGGWFDSAGHPLKTTPIIKGAVIQIQQQSWLLSEAVWRLICAVQAFYTMPAEKRSAQQNRQSWSLIRRYALQAQVTMEDFLQRTVVLSPDKLLLKLHQVNIAGSKTIQVEPSFEGAPQQWLHTFDKYPEVPQRYDIPDGLGIVQVLVSPQVRSVLQEIRRWPGRYVSGQRAEAFIRNPYAALGEDAIAVIDEAQFEDAREQAGIEFERFSVDVEYDTDSNVTGVALLIESMGRQNNEISRYRFDDALHLKKFVQLLETRILAGYQCLVWDGYELELLGDAEDQLNLLQRVLDEWLPKPTISITYADVFDLSRYSERIEGIGKEKQYISAYIARKSDESGWIPNNIDFGIRFSGDENDKPIDLPLTNQDRLQLQQAVAQAEQQGQDSVFISVLQQSIPIAAGKYLLETIDTAEDEVNRGEFKPKIRETGKKLKPTLLLKSNIDNIEYREQRAQVLALPSEYQANLPSQLRSDVSLKTHQLQGVAWLQHLWSHSPEFCRGALLADDMGLGKTLQILTFIARCLEDDSNLAPVLVVAPVSLLENWQEEINKFFMLDSLPTLMLYGANLKSKKLDRSEIDPQLVKEGLIKFLEPNWLGNAKLVLTTYETLRDLEFSLAAQRWSIMVCDEAQKIKNPSAMVTRAAKKQNVRFKIACTGTPVENSLVDLWCLFDFIQPGLLGALNEFGNRYRRPIEAKTEEEKSRVEELRNLIEPQTLRRTKIQVAKDLPNKIEVASCRNLPISSYQRELYSKAVHAYRSKKGDSVIKHHLGLIQYLRQVCCNPYPPGYKTDLSESLAERLRKSPKLKWLLSVLEEIRSRNEKVIVFVEFLDLQRQLQSYIAQQLGIVPDIINGSTTAAASALNSRQKRIKKFQEKSGFGVIILSPLAVGFGVNIQAANHVIHFTRTWNPAKEDQATDRVYRIGQNRDVFVYYPIITADFVTFDVKLDSLLNWKRSLSDDMLNGCDDLSSADFSDIGTAEIF